VNSTRLSRAVAALAGSIALLATAVAAPADAAADGTRYYKVVPTCAKAAPGHAQCLTLQRIRVAKGTKGAQSAPTVSDAGPAGGFTPGNLASAYDVDPSTPTPGQVVGIVDAHDNPDALADLNAFDAQYGLPAETASSFVKVGQDGGAPPVNGTPATDEELGWAGEIALDIEAVRGICHSCKILLVEANTSNFVDLAAGVNTAVRLGATVVSNSYGGAEGSDPGGPDDENDPAVQAAFNHPGVVITASTGDDGYYDYDLAFDGEQASNAPSAPASFPGVVATAGTTLQLNDDGSRAAEVAWNTNGQAGLLARFYGGSLFASGGGCSTEYSAPAWQQATQGWAQTACGNKRLVADVAAVGDPLTGYDIYDRTRRPTRASRGAPTAGPRCPRRSSPRCSPWPAARTAP
jgi:subtilase family serine protease